MTGARCHLTLLVAVALFLGCGIDADPLSKEPAGADAGATPTGDGKTAAGPYYFIAVHNEPFNQSGGETQLAASYQVLGEMIAEADRYGVKLTLMFSAQWADYITASPDRRAALETWRGRGHEVSSHHHSIYHGNWDGYTDYSEAEANAERVKKGVTPEPYHGTLADYAARLHAMDPAIRSGCANDEGDKAELPDAIVHDTCSGFANFGEVGTRLEDTDAEKGKNEFVTVGTLKGIERRWLAHYQITTDARRSAAEGVLRSMSAGVHGSVLHSSKGEAAQLGKFLELLHQLDPDGSRSRTVSRIIEERLIPEKQISQAVLESKGNKKCGDGVCDPLEKANPSLCPKDC